MSEVERDFELVRDQLERWFVNPMPGAREAVGEALGRIEARLGAAEAAMREVLETYSDYEEFDPLRRYLGLPVYDSPEHWQSVGERLAAENETVARKRPWSTG